MGVCSHDLGRRAPAEPRRLVTLTAELRREIIDAFPVRPRPRADEITRADDAYWERAELRHDVKYRSWTTLPYALVLRRRADLIWFAPRGFGYYLPAWMLHAVTDPEIRHYVISALKDYPSWLPEGDGGDGITPRQAGTIIAFLEWVGSPASGHPLGTVHAGPVATAIRSYWSLRAGHGRAQP